MYTLALDTASNSISVAILRDNKVLVEDFKEMERGQAEALIPMVQAVIKNANIESSSINQVAVSVGPGSFTGVRIGLATARGIGLALSIPVCGVTTLQAAVYNIKGPVMSVLDTKRGDFYTQSFIDSKAIEPATIRSLKEIKELKPLRLTGPSAKEIAEEIKTMPVNNGITMAAAVGLHSLISSLPPDPVYLREADVSC